MKEIDADTWRQGYLKSIEARNRAHDRRKAEEAAFDEAKRMKRLRKAGNTYNDDEKQL